MPDISYYPVRTTTSPTDRMFIASGSSDEINSTTVDVLLGGNPVNGYFYRNNLMTRPSASSMTWVNQHLATYTDVPNGPIIIQVPSGGGGEWNYLTVPMPSGDFTSTWCFTPQLSFTSYISTGIGILNSSNQLYSFAIAPNNGYYTLLLERWGSPTSYNNGVFGVPITSGQLMCLQLNFVSSTSTLNFNFSVNGEIFSTAQTLSLSDFLSTAPTQIGFGVKCQGGSNCNPVVGMLYYQYTTQP